MTHPLVGAVADIASSRYPHCAPDLAPADNGPAREEALLSALLEGNIPAGFLLLWQQKPSVIVPRIFARRPGFAQIAQRSSMLGWPLLERMTGGSAVVQHEGILNFSLFLATARHDGRIDHGFIALGTILQDVLARLGLTTDLGPVPRAFCDGRQNLRCRGLKLAGMAAASRARRQHRALLVHASLIVDADLISDLSIISRVEHDLGLNTFYDATVHASLAMLCRSDKGPAPRQYWHQDRIESAPMP